MQQINIIFYVEAEFEVKIFLCSFGTSSGIFLFLIVLKKMELFIKAQLLAKQTNDLQKTQQLNMGTAHDGFSSHSNPHYLDYWKWEFKIVWLSFGVNYPPHVQLKCM